MNEISTFEGQPGHVGEAINLGIVTVSDRASSGTYEDEGGPAILGFFEAAFASPWEAHYRCVPDDIEAIEAALTPEEYRGYLRGQVMKYTWRCNYKGKRLEDLQKARWYLNRYIELLEKEC